MNTSSLVSRIDTSGLIIRPGTSDSASFRQIFTEEELAPIVLPSDALILDCGAYVGYSSYYLLSKFPSSRVLAVEPDSNSFQVLRQNLSKFGRRVQTRNTAIWNTDLIPLEESASPFRDGREWAKTFRPCNPECLPRPESDLCVGVSVPVYLTVLSLYRSIDLLKMDIEGAETLIFAGDVSWLDRINTIAIELHDDSPHGPATPVFFSAVKDRGFELSRSGELTIARRPKREH